MVRPHAPYLHSFVQKSIFITPSMRYQAKEATSNNLGLDRLGNRESLMRFLRCVLDMGTAPKLSCSREPLASARRPITSDTMLRHRAP